MQWRIIVKGLVMGRGRSLFKRKVRDGLTGKVKSVQRSEVYERMSYVVFLAKGILASE